MLLSSSSSATTFEFNCEYFFQKFYLQHKLWLLNHLHHKLGNKADAEDICQKIFLKLREKPELLEKLHNPRAWLATTANRMCIDPKQRKMGQKWARRPRKNAKLLILKEK